MADDLDGPCECEDEPGDDVDETGAEPEIPPHYQSQFDAAEAELQDALDGIYQAVSEQLDAIAAELEPIRAEYFTDFAAKLGEIDTELRTVASPVLVAFERATDAAFRELVYAEEELNAAGHYVPPSVDQKRADLADPTGGAIVERLMGIRPEFPTAADLTPEPLAPDPVPLAPHPFLPPPVPLAESVYEQLPTAPVSPLPVGEPVAMALPVSNPRADEARCGTCPPTEIKVTCEAPKAPVTSGPPSPPTVPPASPPAGRPEFFDVLGGLVPGAPPHPLAEAVGPFAPAPLDVRAGLRWDQVTVCSDANDALKKYKGRNAIGLLDPAETLDSVSGLYRQIRAGFFSAMDTLGSIGQPERDKLKADAERAYYETTGDILGGLSGAAETFNRIDTTAVPEHQLMWNIGLRLASARKSEADSQFPLSYVTTSLEYLYHYAAPQYIPGQPALDAAYLSDQLGIEQWRCLTKAHGNIPKWHEMNLWASAVRPSVSELIALFQRGAFGRDALTVRCREMGVLDPAKVDEYLKLAQFIPSAPDIMRFVKKDVFDDEAVKLGKLDEGFIESFYGRGGKANPGPAVQWARAWGLTDEVFLYDYRASWEFPSNTQVYEMIHRLRPDRLEIREWDNEHMRHLADDDGGKAWDAKNPRPPVFTIDDARAVFKVNDIAPAFVDRLVAISYNPMTRTDALAAFHANAMDSAELLSRLQDTGLDVKTAVRVVEIQQFLKARREANLSGVWSVRKIASAYRSGALLGPAADALLEPLIPDPQQRFNLLRGVDREVEAATRTERIKRIAREHLTGVISDEQTELRLKQMGFPQARIDEQMAQWDSKRRGRLKEPAANEVLKWVKAGIVTAEEGLTRLIRIGYHNDDATRMIATALGQRADTLQTKLRQQQAEVRRVINDQRAARRAMDQELEEARKDAEKQVKKLNDELARILKEQEARKKELQ